MKFIPFLLSLLVVVAAPEAKSLRKPVLVTKTLTQDSLRVGHVDLVIEVADSDSERVQGLSDRLAMPWNHGMLFAFPEAQRRSFWMIDCHFDLDIAYIAPDGTVRDIQAMRIQPGVAPQDLDRYPSASSDIMYALEVNRGWFASQGIRVGDRIPGVTKYRTTR